MQKDFKGKVVIVTGSSSGIGEAIAILFAKRGANVTLCGRDKDRLQAALEKCQQAAGEDANTNKFITVCGDVTEKEIREKIVDDTIKQFGRLDVLVCNHGIAGVSPLFQIGDETEETYDAVMNTNLKSVYFLIQKSVPYLEETQGSIVNISSLASAKPFDFVCYSMSKAALDHMTRCLALQLAPKGIRVNAVNPTYVITRIQAAIGMDPPTMKRLAAAHPLHGRLSTPEEQAEVTVFLASGGASFVTGVCVKVDGAMSLGATPLTAK